jgi:hypothetical protein
MDLSFDCASPVTDEGNRCLANGFAVLMRRELPRGDEKTPNHRSDFDPGAILLARHDYCGRGSVASRRNLSATQGRHS